MKKIGTKVTLLLLSLFALWALAGCASSAKKDTSTASSETALGVSFSGFEDVTVPSELSPVKKKSQVYSAGRNKVGLLTFEGRVEPDSLASFFQNNLPRSGWKQLTALKDRDNVLVFLKDDRVCLITISEGWYYTVCEVRVGMVEKGVDPAKGTPTR